MIDVWESDFCNGNTYGTKYEQYLYHCKNKFLAMPIKKTLRFDNRYEKKNHIYKNIYNFKNRYGRYGLKYFVFLFYILGQATL